MNRRFTEAQMLADLRITFPTLWTRPLREFGKDFKREGVWTGEDVAAMPDGMPIFFSLANGEPPYNGFVHEAFEAWLDRRGWCVETYDGGTHHLLPVEHTT